MCLHHILIMIVATMIMSMMITMKMTAKMTAIPITLTVTSNNNSALTWNYAQNSILVNLVLVNFFVVWS